MDDVHCETLLKQERNYFENFNFSKVQKGIDSLKTISIIDSVHFIKYIEVFDTQLAQFRYFENGKLKIQLIAAETGELRSAFSGQECLELAEQQLKEPISILNAELLPKHSTGEHHEYRGRPLPAYAFTLDHPTKTPIYVATELG